LSKDFKNPLQGLPSIETADVNTVFRKTIKQNVVYSVQIFQKDWFFPESQYGGKKFIAVLT